MELCNIRISIGFRVGVDVRKQFRHKCTHIECNIVGFRVVAHWACDGTDIPAGGSIHTSHMQLTVNEYVARMRPSASRMHMYAHAYEHIYYLSVIVLSNRAIGSFDAKLGQGNMVSYF